MMGTTAAKLQAALDSKEAIRQAIIAKDVAVPVETPLSQYPSKIASIETGGGGAVTPEEFKNAETFVYIDQFGEEVFREVVRIGDAPSPPPGPPLEHCTFRYWQNLPAVAEWHGTTYVAPIYDSDEGDTFVTLLVQETYLMIFLSKEEGSLTIDKGDGTEPISINGAIARGVSTTLSFARQGICTMRIHSEVPYTLGSGTNSQSFIRKISGAGSLSYGLNMLKIIIGSNCIITQGFLYYAGSLQYLVFTHGSNQDEYVSISSGSSPINYSGVRVITFPNTFTGGTQINVYNTQALCILYPKNYDLSASPVPYCSFLKYHSMHQTLGTRLFVTNAANGNNCISEIRWLPGMDTIPVECMSGLSAVNKVIVPEGVTSVLGNAFYQIRVGVLDLPSTLLSIASRGLSGSVTKIIVVRATTPPTLGANNSFSAPDRGLPHIFVPDDSIDAYTSATNWNAFAAYFRPLSEMPNYIAVDENGYPK